VVEDVCAQGSDNNEWTFDLKRVGKLLGTPGGAAAYGEGYRRAHEEMGKPGRARAAQPSS
jgi:hypothetical protein